MTRGRYLSDSSSSSLLGEADREDGSESDGEGDRDRLSPGDLRRPIRELLGGEIRRLLPSSSGANEVSYMTIASRSCAVPRGSPFAGNFRPK